MENNSLSRQEIEWKIIYPALLRAGWEEKQIQYRKRFSNGLSYMKVDNEPLLTFVEAKQPTFTLRYWDNLPLAIIRHAESGESLPNALENIRPWADGDNGGLDLYFLYATDGSRLLELDTSTGRQRSLSPGEIPRPGQLWSRYLHIMGFRPGQGHQLLTSAHTPGVVRPPHYYEYIAENRTLEALLKGQRSIALNIGTLLSTHFIIARLIRHLWDLRFARRFLCVLEKDPARSPQRLALFRHLQPVAPPPRLPEEQEDFPLLVLCSTEAEAAGLLKKLQVFPPDYFDLVIVDEIHHDTAAGDATWQAIASRFHPARQIGLSIITPYRVLAANYSYYDRIIYQYTDEQWSENGFTYGEPILLRREAAVADLRSPEPKSPETVMEMAELMALV